MLSSIQSEECLSSSEVGVYGGREWEREREKWISHKLSLCVILFNSSERHFSSSLYTHTHMHIHTVGECFLEQQQKNGRAKKNYLLNQ